jgi:acid phosphatase family membrane protein YuiD
MAIDLNQPYNATNNGQPVINPQQLAEQYGWAYSFLTSQPELDSLFQEAVAQSWDATRFQAAVIASKWYQTNSASIRNAQVQKVIDPATYSQQVSTEQANIVAQAASMGAAISSSLATTIATQQITFGWNADQVNVALSKYVKLNSSGAFGGSAGQNAMAINELAYNNGVSIPPSTMQNLLQNVASNKMSMEDLQGYIRQMAASKFPGLQKEIAAGQNVSDLASPYTTTMQNTLEVGPGTANLSNPLIQRALNGLGDSGQPTGMNVTDFQKLLKAQPQWAQTQNAQDTTMSTAHTILQNFGLS